MTFDDILKQALNDTIDSRIEKMLYVPKKHRFSLAYRLWERKTLRNFRKNRPAPAWTLQRARRVVAVTLFAAAVVFLLTAGAVVGLAIGRFSFNDKKEYSELFLSHLSSDKTVIEEYYGLPEDDGWTIDYLYTDETSAMIGYARGTDSVTFQQDVICECTRHINTENAVVGPISMYKKDDGFFIEFQNGDCGLWWLYDGYLFSLGGNLDKNDLINLALSTKIVEF